MPVQATPQPAIDPALLRKYEQALIDADWLMGECDIEPLSALKEAARGQGIEFDAPMRAFMNWALPQFQ